MKPEEKKKHLQNFHKIAISIVKQITKEVQDRWFNLILSESNKAGLNDVELQYLVEITRNKIKKMVDVISDDMLNKFP